MWQGPVLATLSSGRHDHYVTWRSHAVIVKQLLIYRDLKLAKRFLFPLHSETVWQLWLLHCDKFKTANTRASPHILHAFFSEVCDIDHLLTFQRDTHQYNLTGSEQSLSFLLSDLFKIYALRSFLLPFLFILSSFAVCLPSMSPEKIHVSFLYFVSWNSAIINCLSTVVITETSEGHMGCNRPLCLLDKEIRIHFCHRIAQYILEKGSLFDCNAPKWVFFFPLFIQEWNLYLEKATWKV